LVQVGTTVPSCGSLVQQLPVELFQKMIRLRDEKHKNYLFVGCNSLGFISFIW
jgi:hypothetical protein